MEKKPALVTIAGKEYELKFTIGFWKKIKADGGITDSNFGDMLKEDFPTVAPKMIIEGIRATGVEPPELSVIESDLDKSCVDIIEQAYINGMTSAEFELLKSVSIQREKKLKEFAEGGQSDDK